MESLHAFFEWAWARHHNVLSWYIRPLFLIPFCWFAYHRSGLGIVATIFALATSMFWFPAPPVVSDAVKAALTAEREYLLGEWQATKLLLALLVPLSFAALAAAFWRRSILWGAVVVNLMVLTKVLWTGLYFDRHAFLAHLLPAGLGLLTCNFAFAWWSRRSVRHADRA